MGYYATRNDYSNEEWQEYAETLRLVVNRRGFHHDIYAALNAVMEEANREAHDPLYDSTGERLDVEPVPEDVARYLADHLADEAHNELQKLATGEKKLNWREANDCTEYA